MIQCLLRGGDHMKRIVFLLLIVSMCGCEMSIYDQDNLSNRQFDDTVTAHEYLLREHFLGHHVPGYDIATLLNNTTTIANQLRKLGRFEDANRFDSYRDVLTYGQYTIEESINDVQKLIDLGVPTETNENYDDNN